MISLALLAALAPAAVDGEVLGYLEARGFGLWGQSERVAELAELVDGLAALGIDPAEHWSVIARLRPTAKLHLTEDDTLVATALAESRQGFFVREPREVRDVVSMQRLYLTMTRGPIDLVAGKQLVAWGSGLVLNPTDVLNDKPVSDLSAERPGTWAALATLALGEAANLHAAAALDPDACCQAVALGRYDHTLGSADVAATVAWRQSREQLTLGFDVKGDLELGWWAEGAWVFDTSAGARDERFLLLEVGADYSFAVLDTLYLALEWIHQGNGVGGSWVGPIGAPPSYLRASFVGGDPSERRLLGSNYGLLLVRLVMSSHVSAQWLNLVNLRDPSGTSVAQLTWTPRDWLELVVGAQASYGAPGTEFHLTTPDLPLLPRELVNQRLQPALVAWLWTRAYY